MANKNQAGIDLQNYHDTAKTLADDCRAAKLDWHEKKSVAASAKTRFDDLVEQLLTYTAEEPPATPLLDDEE